MTKKKVSREEKELYLGEKHVDDSEVDAMIEKVKEGADAPMTEQIFADAPRPLGGDPNSALLIKNGELRDEKDPLIEFIELYQPPTLVDRQKFKRHLLLILETWK